MCTLFQPELWSTLISTITLGWPRRGRSEVWTWKMGEHEDIIPLVENMTIDQSNEQAGETRLDYEAEELLSVSCLFCLTGQVLFSDSQRNVFYLHW